MRKLYRSTMDRKLTGLAGGIGERFGIDPTIIRLILLISGVFSLGTTLLLYIVASVLVPKAPFEVLSPDQAFRYYG
ncbi:PspC domain-containing protein [Paenibacillus sacheonensis]|uniref:PspC domain-containing protein n=1 Tax=Paenibacillus sacheonensis TaxID=742054 RepID=A0A7X4YT96_9BACL|nr:PspC domain-containing protein [Paenibacillus sacheonensis]MBM7568457.1 phage shock protein PspC (stress-responsive transcriptional regulator) [Paenibacillus sacheonensis]NBC72155.1 PspC domain-containing protein [Paenibacillus sacheonensis]